MGTRAETIFQRLQGLVPPPDAVGWHFTRLKLEAEAMGGDAFGVQTQDQQAQLVEDQLHLGAILVRADANPTVWDTSRATDWQLNPALSTGASGFFLDVWGKTLAVPRMQGEADTSYARRIITSLSRSTTTNIGLAQAIDTALGTTGTRVLDASGVLEIIRFNTGHRMNAGHRFNNAGTATSLWCCFVVQVPSAIPDSSYSTFIDIINSRKAAGTRLLGIMLSDNLAPIISSPSFVPQGSTFTATAVVSGDAATAYTWTVTGGTILSGSGTSSITVEAGSTDAMTITLSVTRASGESPTTLKDIPLISSSLAIGFDYAYAGDGPFTATAPFGYTYAWGIDAGYIIGPKNGRSIQFVVGEANQLATIQCALGGSVTMESTIKIIPYTSATSHTTASLAINASENFELDLGWAWDLVSVTVDRPAWVRIYNTDSARSSDASRAITVDPPDTLSDLVWEGIFSDAVLTITDVPSVSGVNGDTPRSKTSYLSVTNLDNSASTVSVTVNRTETKTSGVF